MLCPFSVLAVPETLTTLLVGLLDGPARSGSSRLRIQNDIMKNEKTVRCEPEVQAKRCHNLA